MSESASLHALESVVAALPAEEARKRLFDLLIQFPEKGRELSKKAGSTKTSKPTPETGGLRLRPTPTKQTPSRD